MQPTRKSSSQFHHNQPKRGTRQTNQLPARQAHRTILTCTSCKRITTVSTAQRRQRDARLDDQMLRANAGEQTTPSAGLKRRQLKYSHLLLRPVRRGRMYTVELEELINATHK